MTDDELNAIEARFREAAPRAWAAGDMVYTVVEDDIPALIAEIRRLNAENGVLWDIARSLGDEAKRLELATAPGVVYEKYAAGEPAVIRVKRPSRS